MTVRRYRHQWNSLTSFYNRASGVKFVRLSTYDKAEFVAAGYVRNEGWRFVDPDDWVNDAGVGYPYGVSLKNPKGDQVCLERWGRRYIAYAFDDDGELTMATAWKPARALIRYAKFWSARRCSRSQREGT